MEPNDTPELTFEFTSHGLKETDRLGMMIAHAAQPGDVVSLEGPLGAGKTRLVQGIARGIGAEGDQVTSPTFVILNEYRSGRLPLFHFDVYRLRDEDEFWQLGPEEYFAGEGMSLLEWGDRVVPLLPPRTSRIAIEVTGDSERVYRVTGSLAERLATKLESQ
jgi:tRNA threonylcarbamoyladenosine biosynthesis protein TsaE